MVKQMVRSNMYMLYRSTYYITKENILFHKHKHRCRWTDFYYADPASRLRKMTALNIKLVSKFLFTYRKRVAFGVLMCAFCNACWGVMNALDT